MWVIFIHIFKLLLSLQASDVYQLVLSTPQREISTIFVENIVLCKERRKVAHGAAGGWKWPSVTPPQLSSWLGITLPFTWEPISLLHKPSLLCSTGLFALGDTGQWITPSTILDQQLCVHSTGMQPGTTRPVRDSGLSVTWRTEILCSRYLPKKHQLPLYFQERLHSNSGASPAF